MLAKTPNGGWHHGRTMADPHKDKLCFTRKHRKQGSRAERDDDADRSREFRSIQRKKEKQSSEHRCERCETTRGSALLARLAKHSSGALHHPQLAPLQKAQALYRGARLRVPRPCAALLGVDRQCIRKLFNDAKKAAVLECEENSLSVSL